VEGASGERRLRCLDDIIQSTLTKRSDSRVSERSTTSDIPPFRAPRPWALGLVAGGCADDTPRAGSADIAASRKAAAERRGGLFNLGRRHTDVAPIRTRGKGLADRSTTPPVKTQGKTR
jgi:hypothetical protein